MGGLFITFEGIEGSGKSTQLARLAGRLRVGYREVLTLREPGGTVLGEQARDLLLARSLPDGRTNRLPAWGEAFLVLAARAQLVEEVVRPALERNALVLCDRYADSTVAYQGGGRGLDRLLLQRLNREATGGLMPRLTLLMDLPVSTALSRLERGRSSGELTRFDQESLSFHEHVRAAFLSLAKLAPQRIVVLDAARDPDAVMRDVWERVQPVLP